MATAPSTANPLHNAPTQHVDKGMEAALGIGQNGKLLNTHCQDLQWAIEDIRDEFLRVQSIYINDVRHDVMRNGLLGEIVSRTPILVYDLQELKDIVDTAFVDMSGKMYIADTFARRIVAEHRAGKDSANFLVRHEGDHLRRLHMARMLELPRDIANAAQDIRINIDNTKGETAQRHYDATGRDPSDADLLEAARVYLDELSTTAVSIGWAMNIEDYRKYDGLSEESIGAMLMADWKEPPRMPNREVSFELIMEGAAQESDLVKGMLLSGTPLAATPPQYAMTPAELSGLAQDLRAIGKSKANPARVTDAQIKAAKDLLTKLREHQGLMELDIQHSKASMALAGTAATHNSGKTGDAYLDALKPSERIKLAIKVLDQILNPKPNSGLPGKPQNGGMTIKDLERNLNRGSGGQPQPGQGSPQPGQPGSGQPQPGQQGAGDPDTIPAPNVYHSHDHIMGTEDLVNILKGAGVSQESLEKLGYDDLAKIKEETAATKDGVAGAINKASEDAMRVGSRYPGGHLLNYAKAQMRDFFKPVLTWEMALKKIIEGSGKGSRYAPDEAWTIFHVNAADMGFKHQNDVPYMGSRMPGKEQKPLIFVLIDTSGSVDDAMLKRFVTEALNMARKVSRGVAPDVAIVFADTVARGAPVFITEKNYKQFLANGIDYGGRGGTSLHASVENVFEMVRPGSKSGYAKRNLDAIVYMTDTGDSAPNPSRLLAKARECGLKKLPTTLWLAPKACHDDAFKTAVKTWSEIIYFDTTPGLRQVVKLDQIAAQQDQKNAGLTAAPKRARP
jgi:hypothetical protein